MLKPITLFKKLSTPKRLELLLELLKSGSQAWLQPGDFLFKQGEPARHFYFLLEGEIKASRQVKNRELTVATYEKDSFFGEIALLGGTEHLFSGLALSSSCVYCVDKDNFWQMIALFPSIRNVVLECRDQRRQELELLSQNHEKFIAVGTLAAGLAHELNNPVAAAHRAVSQLQNTMSKRYTLLLKYMKQYLTPEQMKVLVRLKHNTFMYATESICLDFSLDPLTQIDLEDRLVTWLEERGINNAWKLATSLLPAGVTPELLEEIGEQVTTEAFEDLLTLLERMVTEASLLNVLDRSTKRVFKLVSAVKNYSYLEQVSVKQSNLSIHDGIDSTLTVLSHKLKKHLILVKREYAHKLPLIYGNGATLNQVWSNLIDNAIDAIEKKAPNAIAKKGTISIRTLTTKDQVIVEMVDDGVGIPTEIQSRIYDPFFTTKAVDQGTGIGLNLVYQVIVSEHKGNIQCCSEPGCTCFRVYLPISS